LGFAVFEREKFQRERTWARVNLAEEIEKSERDR
jgi:hypothetical protein